jgi:hypothetical protein
VFTDALKPAGKTWTRFDRHRAKVLERRALDALEQALRPQWSYGSVKYWYTDEQGATAEGEADGVLRTDGLVVLVESKAGSLPESARRASPDRLQRALRDLILSAHDQLERSAEVLIAGKATKVVDDSGRPLQLDLDGVTRVVRVAVSLEDLAPLAPSVWQLQEAGLLPTGRRTPWTVGIHELELICAMAERPAQVLHYILRRLRTYRQKVWAMDELDFWMRYLDKGLYWEDDELADRMMQLLSHTDPLDAWVYGDHGRGRQVKKPRQKQDAATRKLLDMIEATKADGRLEAQVMLLETDSEARRRLSSSLARLAKQTSRDQRIHDMTLAFDDEMAITVQSVPPSQQRGNADLLAKYGLAKMEQHGLRRWVGLGTEGGSGGRLTSMVVLTDPSRVDDV